MGEVFDAIAQETRGEMFGHEEQKAIREEYAARPAGLKQKFSIETIKVNHVTSMHMVEYESGERMRAFVIEKHDAFRVGVSSTSAHLPARLPRPR